MTVRMFTPEEVGVLLAALGKAIESLDEPPPRPNAISAQFLRNLKGAIDFQCHLQPPNVRPDHVERFYQELIHNLRFSGAYPRLLDDPT